jgi:SNF2 family DNA or RNA helicase
VITTILENNEFKLILPGYDQQISDSLKKIYGVRYNPQNKSWRAPVAAFGDLVKIFGWLMDFQCSYEQIEAVEKDIGPIMGAIDPMVANSMKLQPYDYQLVGGTAFLPVVKTGILADEVGLGKTLQCILGFTFLDLRGLTSKCLVFCKKGLKSQWLSELEKFTFYNGIVIDGDIKKRERLYEEAKDPKYQFVIVNYDFLFHDKAYLKKQNEIRIKKKLEQQFGEEEFKKLTVAEQKKLIDKELRKLGIEGLSGYNDFNKINELAELCQVLICDEAQKLKDPKTKTHKNTAKLAEKMEYRWALTGTPVENSPMDIFYIAKVIIPHLFGWDPRPFRARYYEGDYFDKIRHDMLDDLRIRVAPYMLRRLQKEVKKFFPEVTNNDIWLDMTDEQVELHDCIIREAYKAKDEDMGEVDEDELEESVTITPLTAFSLLLRLADSPELLASSKNLFGQKVFKGKFGTKKNIESPKLDWLESYFIERYAMDLTAKTIVFSRSSKFVELIQSRLEQEGLPELAEIRTYTGKLSTKNRKLTQDWFWDEGQGRILLATDAAAEGLNLQVADVLINADMPFNPGRLEQRIGRIKRAGSPFNHVQIFNLMMKESIENRVQDIIYNKQKVFDKVVQGNVYKVKMDKSLLGQLIK